jgi:hypothetical protein
MFWCMTLREDRPPEADSLEPVASDRAQYGTSIARSKRALEPCNRGLKIARFANGLNVRLSFAKNFILPMEVTKLVSIGMSRNY